MQARETTTTNRNRLLQSDLLLLALQIAVPVGVVDLIGGGVAALGAVNLQCPVLRLGIRRMRRLGAAGFEPQKQSRGIKRCR